MAVIKDPQGNEISALNAMVDFSGLSVLEIGCGDGRLTWLYAGKAAHVTAIDPDGEAIEAALANTPPELEERVSLLQSSIQDFAASSGSRRFDLALFSWSL